MTSTSSQDLLWSVVGDWWWTGYAAVCAGGAVLLFRSIMLSAHRNLLTVAHIVVLGGFILGAFVRLNSACQPLSGALLATGALFAVILTSTGWYQRPGRPKDKALALVREALWGRLRQPH